MTAMLIAFVAGVVFVLLLMRLGLWRSNFHFRRLGWFAAWAIIRHRRSHK